MSRVKEEREVDAAPVPSRGTRGRWHVNIKKMKISCKRLRLKRDKIFLDGADEAC